MSTVRNSLASWKLVSLARTWQGAGAHRKPTMAAMRAWRGCSAEAREGQDQGRRQGGPRSLGDSPDAKETVPLIWKQSLWPHGRIMSVVKVSTIEREAGLVGDGDVVREDGKE